MKIHPFLIAITIIVFSNALHSKADSRSICAVEAANATLKPNFLYSPFFPEKYPHYLDCETIISAPYGQIEIKIIVLELEKNVDYLSIFKNNINSENLIEKLTYKWSNHTVVVESSVAVLHFTTDDTTYLKGFNLSYQIHFHNVCEGKPYLNATNEETLLISPGFPDFYENRLNCHTILSAGWNHFIEITISIFHLELSSDFLEIYEGQMSQSKSLVFSKSELPHLPFSILIRSPVAKMIFRTDKSKTNKGFQLTYRAVNNSVVGNNLLIANEKSQNISSPGYPKLYALNVDYNTNIVAGNNKFIGLEITSLQLAQESNLTITEGPNNSTNNEFLFHFTKLPYFPYLLILKSSSVKLHFTSGKSKRDVGFQIKYRAVYDNYYCPKENWIDVTFLLNTYYEIPQSDFNYYIKTSTKIIANYLWTSGKNIRFSIIIYGGVSVYMALPPSNNLTIQEFNKHVDDISYGGIVGDEKVYNNMASGFHLITKDILPTRRSNEIPHFVLVIDYHGYPFDAMDEANMLKSNNSSIFIISQKVSHKNHYETIASKKEFVILLEEKQEIFDYSAKVARIICNCSEIIRNNVVVTSTGTNSQWIVLLIVAFLSLALIIFIYYRFVKRGKISCLSLIWPRRRDHSIQFDTDFTLRSKATKIRLKRIKKCHLSAYVENLAKRNGFSQQMKFLEKQQVEDCKKGNIYESIFPSSQNCIQIQANADWIINRDNESNENQHWSMDVKWIASAGPNALSLPYFWQVIWHCNVYCIIMLTQLSEWNKEMCVRYWPLIPGESMRMGSISVALVNENLNDGGIMLRQLCLQTSHECRYITQIHCQTWDHRSIPTNETMDCIVKLCQSTVSTWISKQEKTVLVHCSDGIGRTGTFLSLIKLIEELQNERIDDINVLSAIVNLRKSRENSIDSEEQLEFVYRYLMHYQWQTDATEVDRTYFIA